MNLALFWVMTPFYYGVVVFIVFNFMRFYLVTVVISCLEHLIFKRVSREYIFQCTWNTMYFHTKESSARGPLPPSQLSHAATVLVYFARAE